MSQLPNTELGNTLPPFHEHAIVGSVRRWRYIEGYCNNDTSVTDRMRIDYPRFVIHHQVRDLRSSIITRYATSTDDCFPFPSLTSAQKCIQWVTSHAESKHPSSLRILTIGPFSKKAAIMPFNAELTRWTTFYAVIFRKEDYGIAFQYWMHRGVGLCSRHTELVLPLFKAGVLIAKTPRGEEGIQGKKVENEHWERYLPMLPVLVNAEREKEVIRDRIAGLASLGHEERPVKGEDVFLYQAGMSAISHAHDALIEGYSEGGKRLFVEFGFPYLDTMHVIDKWGPGCLFYGHNTPEEIDDWELRLKKGERFAGIFLETPGNPLTQTADLPRIKKLSLEYNIPILIDETVGSWVNVDALKFADLTVTSLSKSFSGYCDVMAGCIVLNPSSPHYSTLKSTLTRLYSDDIFPPEALILEQNSRNYSARAKLMSSNAESLADYLSAQPLVAKVNFPKWTNRQNFDHVRRLDGKFGMIMSVFFETKEDAVVFFDHLETAKGGSLGTNFTLSIAFATMAFGRSEKALMHARSYGVVEECVRVSVGLEDIGELRKTFGRALEKVGEARKARSRL